MVLNQKNLKNMKRNYNLFLNNDEVSEDDKKLFEKVDIDKEKSKFI